MYQCPLGLVLHFYEIDLTILSQINSQVSMPSRASAPFLHSERRSLKKQTACVSMPSRASAPFLRYPFENLGFMRFLEPVFAGIYQNILTMAIFRVC